MGMLLFRKDRKNDFQMISYQRFYETLYKLNITKYVLLFIYGVRRMKYIKAIMTTTLDTLRNILNCSVENILKYIPPNKYKSYKSFTQPLF